jgi:hypothetical protein
MRRFCPASEEKMRPAGADFQELFAGIVQTRRLTSFQIGLQVKLPRKTHHSSKYGVSLMDDKN